MEFFLEIHIEKAHESIIHFKIQHCASTLSTFKLYQRKKEKDEEKCMNAQRYPSPLGFISSNGIQ